MKKTFYIAAAAFLMASTAAHAGSGISFQIDGQKIHIDAPRNCSSLSCISITNNGSAVNLKNFNLKGKKADDDDVASNAPPPAPAAAPPAPAAQAPAAPAPAAVYAPPAPSAPVANATQPAPDASRERISGLPANTTTRTAPSAPPAPAAGTAPAAPAPVANNASPAPVAESAPPAAAPTTPLGLWQTADNKGNVRIEPCGANLCGFAEHTNERILINMKPSSDNKWTGRIHDPDSGSNYDSNIAMKGPNLLKVQGCAFGLFCGGQTWKRIS